MLFRFGVFWKLVLAFMLSWCCWAVIGFEFTIVSMLAILIVLMTGDRHFLL